MRWVNGVTLAEKIKNEAPLPLLTILRTAQKLARALGAAHSKNVLHRDIKPTNILIDEKEEPFVMDFGVARLVGEPGITRTGIFLGTPNYASPEQAKLLSLDPRSDLYSLGVVIFEMATGTRPFEADDAKRGARASQDGDTARRERRRILRPGGLARIIRRCLAKGVLTSVIRTLKH